MTDTNNRDGHHRKALEVLMPDIEYIKANTTAYIEMCKRKVF